MKRLMLKKDKKKIILEDYYQPVRVGNLWSRNFIEYESNGDRNKTASTEEYLNEIRPYLKDTINDLKNLIHGKLS